MKSICQRGLSLNNLGHFTPCFGFLLSESQPGRLILGQRCSGRVSASLAFLLYHGCVGQFKGAEHCSFKNNGKQLIYSSSFKVYTFSLLCIISDIIHLCNYIGHTYAAGQKFLKEVSKSQQGCIYLIKNTVKTTI